MERTLVLIKPDGMAKGLQEEIKKRLTATGLTITAEKSVSATEEMASAHYHDVAERHNPTIAGYLISYLTSAGIEAMVVEGENAVAEVRRIAGATQPVTADKGTIRGDLSEDSYEKADGEGRAVQNLVHASDSVENAEREIAIWFPELA